MLECVHIMINMVMNDDTWHLIKKIKRVSNFLGAGNKPVPLRKDEAERILGINQEDIAKMWNKKIIGNTL